MPRPAVGVINFQKRSLQQRPASSHVEFLRPAGHEPPDNRLDFTADHAVVGSGETGVAKKGRAPREDLLIGRLDMSVRADERADAPIKQAGEGDFFRCRFCMKVNEDEAGGLSQSLDFRQGGVEWIVQWRQKRAPLKIQDSHRGQAVRMENVTPLSRSSRRIIERSQEPALALDQVVDFLLIPKMIAAGDDVHTRREDFLGGFGSDAGTPGRVFAISDDQLQAMPAPQFRKKLLDCAPPRVPDDVPDEQHFHGFTVTSDITAASEKMPVHTVPFDSRQKGVYKFTALTN